MSGIFTRRGDAGRGSLPSASFWLAFYLLFLQGVVAGVAAEGRVSGAGLFGASICFSKSDRAGEQPSIPSRFGHRFESCCAFHAAGAGAPAAAWIDLLGERPSLALSVKLGSHDGAPQGVATPPVGSRAPPILS